MTLIVPARPNSWTEPRVNTAVFATEPYGAATYNGRLSGPVLPRLIILAVVVALLHIRAATAAVATSEDVPLPGGTASLAQALGIDPVPDRGRFVYEVVRLLYNAPEGRKPATELFLQTLRTPMGKARRAEPQPDTRPAELVPIPLTVDLWGSAIFHRRVQPRELVTAIVADRSAALVCLALASLDDATLEYFAEHASVLERAYEKSPMAFGAFAGSLRVQNNRLVPPGGEAAAPLWEALVAEKVTRPERFLQLLLETGEGRLAYTYDLVARLDAPHRAFVLGSWMPSATARADRFKAFAASVGAFREAHLKTLPFGRASFDLSMTLMRLQVEPDGRPKKPASRGLWTRIFAASDASRVADDDPIDAAWLSEQIGPADVRLRAERLDQLAFGQRVFATAAPEKSADVLSAVRGLSHYRMLMWTLERIGITAPEVYAAAARKAARIGLLDGRRGFEAQAQFQGALAIVARMRAVRAVTVARAQALVEQLVALPLTDDGRYAGAVARWVQDEIVRRTEPADTLEATVLAAMSGGPSGDGPVARNVTWEGQPYRLDLGAAERRRLQRVRERQEGVPLDVPLVLAADARSLAEEKTPAEDLPPMLARLAAAAADIPRRVGHESDDMSLPGVPASKTREVLRRTLDDLARDARDKNVKHAALSATPLVEASDTLLAQALMSIAYAADVGDPEGAVLLADDVSLRHDFGLGAKDSEMRQRAAWVVPRPEVNPGVPWHVSGSLLGLDLGLSQLALRRLNFERVLEAPRLTSNERDTFALSVSLMNPYDLRDADRDAIAAAVDRGRRQIASIVGGDAAALERIADELSVEGWRRRALRWMLAREPDRIPAMFSLTEMLALGGGRTPELDRWGMSMLAAEGCPCSRLTPPGRWPTLLGRPPLGLTGTAVADLHLYTAIMLRELRLPAALAKVVLSGAAQDFIDDVRPTDDSDWLTLARTARTMTRERMEDYIAAATASGPLIPEKGTR